MTPFSWTHTHQYPLITGFVILVFLVINGLLFSHYPTTVAQDTGVYETIAARGWGELGLWAGERPFTVPVIYKILGTKHDAIVQFQTGLWAVAWIFLAYSVSKVVKDQNLALVAFSLILAFGVSDQVWFWNKTLLSESIANSLMAMTLATGLLWMNQLMKHTQPSMQLNLSLAILLVLWSFTRDTHMYTILFISFLTCALLAFSIRTRKIAATGIVLALAIFALQSFTADAGKRWQFPLVNVISQRVLTDQNTTNFFVDNGMPVTQTVTQFSGKWASSSNWEGFGTWLDTKGKNTYIKYLLAHPVYSLYAPIENWEHLVDKDIRKYYSNIDQQYRLPYQRVLTGWTWAHEKSLTLLLTVSLILAAISLRQQKQLLTPLLLSALIVVAMLPTLAIIWHGDAMEVSRHAVGAATTLRLAIWVTILIALDILFGTPKRKTA